MPGDPGSFAFATAARIEFGPGKIAETGHASRTLGRHALVVTGRTGRHADRLREQLASAGVALTRHSIPGEPTLADIQAGAITARASECDHLIGLGGGSALDAAKAIAALLTNPGDPLRYLEVIGHGRPLEHSPAPVIAIPTTAGTGAEVTRNAVLASPTHKVKVSLRHPLMLPRLAIIDPELTHDLPPALTAATGLDALTQLIEPFTCNRSNPITAALCREALPRAAHALRHGCENPTPANRADLALASLHGGLALANSGLGAVHGFAAPLGGQFPAPHGAVCAALLPHVMAANLAALRARAPQSPALARYDELAQLLCGDSRAEVAIEWIHKLVADLRIPRLATYGFPAADTPARLPKAQRASSMKAKPIELTEEELADILCAAT